MAMLGLLPVELVGLVASFVLPPACGKAKKSLSAGLVNDAYVGQLAKLVTHAQSLDENRGFLEVLVADLKNPKLCALIIGEYSNMVRVMQLVLRAQPRCYPVANYRGRKGHISGGCGQFSNRARTGAAQPLTDTPLDQICKLCLRQNRCLERVMVLLGELTHRVNSYTKFVVTTSTVTLHAFKKAAAMEAAKVASQKRPLSH